MRAFAPLTLAAALLVVAIFVGIMISLAVGAWLAFKSFGFGFFTTQAWNPGHREIRRAGARFTARWSPRRWPCWWRFRSASALRSSSPRSARARSSGPSASPSNCSQAFPASSTASGAFSFSRPISSSMSSPGIIERLRQRAGAAGPVRRSALWHRHVHRLADPVDHDLALHFGGDARCVRNRAADPEGSRLRAGLHAHGK